MHWTVKVEGGPRRVNHAAVELNGLIYSFGGYCSGEPYEGNEPIDVHVLDTETYRWRKLNVHCEEPMDTGSSATTQPIITPYQRYGHTVVAYKGKAYLWGGRNDEHGASAQMHIFDPETCSWSLVERNGPCPPARDGHSAVVVDDTMYVFGGFEEESQRFSRETYAFDLQTHQWSEIRTTGVAPQWRDFHTACAINNKMYVFGGRSDQLGQFHSSRDLYCDRLKVLDLKTTQWYEPNVTGDRPSGRRSHSAWTHNGRMYIFGGYLGTINQHLGDLYEYDPTASNWRRLYPFGEGPSPRRRQCTVLVNDRLFLFGGTMPRKTAKLDPNESGLSDLSDLYVLDYKPTLKSLAAVAVVENRLYDSSANILPRELRQELMLMTQPNKITLPRHDG
ncbi:Kelch domain-containing protein 3 [Toxocara canis]|uniref:Kelch domain-containing protein 3 n=1 Tax=Toxocara canis TaxID=6265 RepID=A0A0B2VBR1_TOXCA|nr:Kelch domain-containing protein 3 [Toxocara canis]